MSGPTGNGQRSKWWGAIQVAKMNLVLAILCVGVATIPGHAIYHLPLYLGVLTLSATWTAIVVTEELRHG